jgi:putative transposase
MSFWRNYFHLVWTTKQRQLFIDEAIEPQIYAQMVNQSAGLECFVYAINGMADHVHLVLSIPPKHSVAEVVKQVKGSSSHFVNQIIRPAAFTFEWQRGYGCFSLGQSQLSRAITYVEQQKIHHAQYTTNVWLERSSEHDEGPTPRDHAQATKTILREETIGYDVLGDLPF